jgi:hypothetical protein
MPVLPNPKHEAFCQARALGKSQEQAYVQAGYKPDSGAAARLSGNVSVQVRLMELQEGRAEKFEVTVESMARQFDEDRTFAYTCKNPGAAVAATLAKAKLFGLMTDRSVVNVTHNYAMMSEEELRFEIAAIHAEARALKAGVQH